MEISLYELGSILGSTGNYLDFEDVKFTGIKTDSRIIEEGDLFICLEGENFDGHSFAKDAVSRGARAVVAMKLIGDIENYVPIVMVRDTYLALLDIAKHLREKYQGKVIAITGSCGKTTTKEILYSILSISHKVGKNYKNWNNLVGVPLSIFKFNGDEEFWILELGINVIGEMDKLGDVVRPDIACIPNIGPVHLEGLGSIKGVAREKARILDYISGNGFGIINKNYIHLAEEAAKKSKNIVFFGEGSSYDIEFKGVDKDLQGKFRIFLERKVLEIKTNLNMSTFGENILAAACVAHKLGVSDDDILKGIQEVSVPEHRSKWILLKNFLIFDDCYNANPMAMKRIFDDFSKMSIKRPFIAILGDMLELGKYSNEEHYKLGKLVAEKGIDFLFYKGEYFEDVKNGLKSVNSKIPFFKINQWDEFIDIWRNLKISRGTIIVKGSRGIKLEEAVKVLSKEIKYK
jgi:UDP-N-acetylmuramoyl-tripeptide--D-alanyl-D-alanine ligase